MTIQIEYTDTYGGEANYSWVRRKSIKVRNNISDLALTRRVKKEMDLNGVRGRTDKLGELTAFRPNGMATVLFFHPDN